MMFLHIISLLLAFIQLSAAISCYDCPNAPSQFPGIILVNNLPDQILYCPSVYDREVCSIEYEWDLTDSLTYIKFSSDDQTQTAVNHTLIALVVQDGTRVVARRGHRFHYTCMTDGCNNIDRLKLLLQSLTIVSSFNTFENILDNDQPFQGSWCILNANFSDSECPSPSGIQSSDCLQCVGKYMRDDLRLRYCSSCLTSNEQAAVSAQRQVVFDMIRRSKVDNSLIVCKSPNCNGLETKSRIEENSELEFDFARFLDSTTTTSTTPTTTKTQSTTAMSSATVLESSRSSFLWTILYSVQPLLFVFHFP